MRCCVPRMPAGRGAGRVIERRRAQRSFGDGLIAAEGFVCGDRGKQQLGVAGPPVVDLVFGDNLVLGLLQF